jgi:hypothetical protein
MPLILGRCILVVRRLRPVPTFRVFWGGPRWTVLIGLEVDPTQWKIAAAGNYPTRLLCLGPVDIYRTRYAVTGPGTKRRGDHAA